MSSAAWFWHAGATLILADIAATSRTGVSPEWWLLIAGVVLMGVGLSVAVVHGFWDAWEQYNTEDRGDFA